MTKLRNDDWVVVADGEKALFLCNKTDGQNPHLEVVRKKEQDNPKDIDQSANRPGRTHQSSGVGDPHMMTPIGTNLPRSGLPAILRIFFTNGRMKAHLTGLCWLPHQAS